jgi:hypothetical protein
MFKIKKLPSRYVGQNLDFGPVFDAEIDTIIPAR